MDVAEKIHHILRKQPSLLDDITADQAAKLFTGSVSIASQLESSPLVVITIDGLDETSRDRLEYTAKIFSSFFMSLEAYSNVKVFISSQTEHEIQASFVLPSRDKHVKRIHLHTSHPSSIQDVSQYIKRVLGHIVKKHDLNWDVWPGNQQADALSRRALGLFIWGVTAMKFIEEQFHINGTEGLSDVLDMLTADVLYDINAVYMLILNVTLGRHPSDWDLERFRRIIGAIVFLQEPICIDDLTTLLELHKDPFSDGVDMVHFVHRFRTILVTGAETIDGKTTPRIHTSSFEFTTSNNIDSRFRVEPELALLELAIQCLTHLSTAREFTANDMLPIPFRYASCFWSSHLSQAKILGSAILCADRRRSATATPPLFTSVTSAPPVRKPIWIQYYTPTSETIVTVKQPLVWNALSGDPASYGHQAHVNGIAFSVDGNDIVLCSDDKTIKVCSVSNDKETRKLVKHSRKLKAVACSPNGKSIVAGSDDGLLYTWDHSTGVPLHKPLRGHRGPVTCIAFSFDGKRIISGSSDKTCRVWNAQSGQAVGEPWTGHKSEVKHIAFSSRGGRVCSVEYDKHCVVWDINTRQKIHDWKYNWYLMCLSFLPIDDDIIAVGGEKGIEIQSNNQKWLIPGAGITRWLSFLPDGNIIFSTWDTIFVAEIGRN